MENCKLIRLELDILVPDSIIPPDPGQAATEVRRVIMGAIQTGLIDMGLQHILTVDCYDEEVIQ